MQVSFTYSLHCAAFPFLHPCIEGGAIFGLTYVENNDEQEIDICNVVELQEDVFGHEGERGILGSPDLVAGVGEIQMTLFIALGFRDRDVEVDRSRLSIGGFSAVGGYSVVRNGAVIGPALLISRLMSLVETVDDGDTFPHAAGAGLTCGSPSLSLSRFRDVARDLTNLTSGLGIILSREAHRSHLGHGCAQAGHITSQDSWDRGDNDYPVSCRRDPIPSVA